MEDIKIRLIDVKTLGLQELLFDPTRVPKYAILSHTWGDSEVSFRQWNQWVQDRTSTSQHEGFEKVRLACIEARKLRYKYLWADTCCIRDDNEKEKHSCIDSMFEFYESSAVCLAYLSDLEHHDDTHSMGKCRWYRRGWTLQELIAPRNLRFYDRGWRYRGTKYELCRLVSRITRIDADVLTHKRRLGTVPTEEKKSWLRGRRTTHRRDKYYCLLGLFGMKRDRQAGNSPSPFTDNAQLQQDGPKYFETGYQSLVQQHDDGYGFTFQDFYSPKDLGELSIGRAGDWQYFHPIPGTGSTSSGANDIIYSLSISTDQGLVPPSVVPLHEPESMGGLELSHEGCINPASNVLVPVGDDPCDHREYKASPGSNLSHDTLVQPPTSFASAYSVPPAGMSSRDRSARDGKKSRQKHQQPLKKPGRRNHRGGTQNREPASLHSTYQNLSEATTPVADAGLRDHDSDNSAAVRASQMLSQAYASPSKVRLISQGVSNDGPISIDSTYHPFSQGDIIYDQNEKILDESFNNGYWIGQEAQVAYV